MPRKRKTITEEVIPDGAEDINGEQVTDFDVALESVEDAETLRGVLEQFGQSGATFKIYRQTSSGDSFCYVTDTIDEEFIQKNYGGGDFKVRVFINGKFRIPMKLKIEPRMDSGSNGNGVHTDSTRHSEFLEKLLLTMIANQGSNHGPSITDLTAALSNLDGLRGKQESGMDIFQKGVSFAREILDLKPSGTGDWKSDLVGAAKDAIPVIGGLLAGRNGNPVPPAAPIQETTMQPQQITPEQETALLKQGIDYLKKQCLKNVNPDLIIEWVENNAEDYQFLIDKVLNLPFEKFVEIDNAIGNEPFKQWFIKLFDGFRSSFVPDDNLGVDSTGDDGDNHHSGNNGKSRKDTKPKSA